MAIPAARTLLLPFDEGVLATPAADNPWLFLNASPIEPSWRERVEAVQGSRPDFLALQMAGFPVRPVAERRPYPGALILLGRHRGQNEGWLADALDHVEPGGPIVVAGDKAAGIDSFRKRTATIAAIDDRMSKHHAVVFWFRRPAGLDAPAVAALRPAPARIDGRFETTPGMFSHGAIDRGSALLARHLDGRVHGAVADFGAGWGFLAAECLEQFQQKCEAVLRPELRKNNKIEHLRDSKKNGNALELPQQISRLDLYEADHDALEAARRNLAGTDRIPLGFYWIDLSSEPVPERYDTIVMTPPFHIGRAAEPSLGVAFIKAAHKALKPGGTLLMVANRQLPYEATLKASFRSVALLDEAGGFKVIEARAIPGKVEIGFPSGIA